MKKLLITGASGLLGLNTALESAKDFDVYGVTYQRPIHTTAFHMISTDLTTPDAVQQIYAHTQPDWVIHCAALTDLEACESKPALAEDMNAQLPARMAAEAKLRAARFIHISTDAVFDGEKGDYSEENKPNPLSVYAQTKLAGEQAVAAIYPESIIARVNMFGWSPSGERSLAEYFYNTLRKGNPVKGFTDVFFSPLLVNDLAQILLRMLETKISGLYHVFSADAISKYDFGIAIADRFGLDANLISPTAVKDSGLSTARSPKLSMRTDKLSQALGLPLPSVSSGLERFIEQYNQGYPKTLSAMLEAVV